MTPTRKQPLSTEAYVSGILAGERGVLARAITLVESRREDHRVQADAVLQGIMPHTGKAVRVGISGPPGVGKSTFIEGFGTYLTGLGETLAVLAVDPTSSLSGGSILGDKTRMERLGRDPRAYIRPSPTSGTLGGVARCTRETLLLCEAAGFSVILVETVGVGQSEIVVSEMVDFFLVLALPGAGDELQGIKRGILEMADLIAVNKCDGDNALRARRSRQHYRAALHLLGPRPSGWTPEAILTSGQEGLGLVAVWEAITEHRRRLSASGHLQERRQRQQLTWMWSIVEDRLLTALRAHPAVKDALPELEAGVRAGNVTPALAAQRLLARFLPE